MNCSRPLQVPVQANAGTSDWFPLQQLTPLRRRSKICVEVVVDRCRCIELHPHGELRLLFRLCEKRPGRNMLLCRTHCFRAPRALKTEGVSFQLDRKKTSRALRCQSTEAWRSLWRSAVKCDPAAEMTSRDWATNCLNVHVAVRPRHRHLPIALQGGAASIKVRRHRRKAFAVWPPNARPDSPAHDSASQTVDECAPRRLQSLSSPPMTIPSSALVSRAGMETSAEYSDRKRDHRNVSCAYTSVAMTTDTHCCVVISAGNL